MKRRLDHDDEIDIREAVRSGDIDRLRTVLNIQDKPVPAPDDMNCLYALFLGAYDGRTDIAETMCEKGLNVNLRAPEINWSALEIAADYGQTGFMRVLLDHGADPDVRSQNGWTPLMSAAYKGRAEAVRLLLEAGADVNAKSPGNYTAVVLATSANHPDTVKLLLEAGADRNVRDRDGWLPMDYALQKEDLSDPSYQIHARDPELANLLKNYFPPRKQKAQPAPKPPGPKLIVPKPAKPVRILPRKNS